MLFFEWFVFWTMVEVNSSIMRSNIHAIRSLTDLHHQQLLMLSWLWDDGYCQNGTVTWSLALLTMLGGNTLVMNSSEQITYQLPYVQAQTWGGSIDAWGVAALTQTILPVKAAKSSIMGKCRSTALGLYKMQNTKSLTLCWHSFSDWGSDHVAVSCAHNGYLYIDFGYMQ
jgi:hypothetical protein